MASPEGDAAAFLETATPTLDDQTIRQTPCPRAASTTLHPNVPVTQKLYESIMFSTPPNDDMEQSSLGILSCNFDASLINFSNNASVSILLNKSRKHSTLPSIPESPNKMLSPLVKSEDVASDDVFEDDKNVDQQNEDENKENVTNSTNKPEVRFSISNLSKIDFRDDQISARSSTADSYLLDKSLSSFTNGAKPGTFSHLFSRHALDVSAFTDALPVVDSKEETLQSNKDNSAFKTVAVSNKTPPVKAEPRDNKSLLDDDADLHYFKSLGRGSEPFDNLSTNSEEFVSGGNFLAVLEKDEELFKKDTDLLIPENAFGNCSVRTPDPSNEFALRTSWLSAVNRHDITRPSWLSSEDNVGNASRVSIGEFIRARTESLGIGPEETVHSDVERPNFGVPESVSPENSDDQPLTDTLPTAGCSFSEGPKPPVTVPNLSKFDNLMTLGLFPRDAISEGLMRSSAISLLLSDVTLNGDNRELVNRIMQAARFNEGLNPALPVPTSSAMIRHDETSIEFSSSILPVMSESAEDVRKNGIDKSVQASRSLRSAANIGGGDKRSCSPLSSRDAYVSSSVGLKPLVADQQDFVQDVRLPKEVVIDTPYCVETPVEAIVSINNSSAHWLEGSMRLLRLLCDVENVNVATQPPIVRVDSLWTMEPNASHNLKVVFVPPKKGNWEALLQPFFRHLSASSRSSSVDENRWRPFPSVTLKVTAEIAHLSTNPAEILDFGLVPEECLIVSHILVVNEGETQLPIRLIIEGSPVGGQGFYFPQDNLNNSSVVRSSSSCISGCVLGKTCPMVKVPVAFKAPTFANADHGIMTVSAFVRIELEIPGPAPVLKKIALKAFVSPVRLCSIPKNETVELTYPTASSRRFPLANIGAIPLNLELFTDTPQELTVAPINTELMPGQEIGVQLVYHPTDPTKPLQSFLKIKVIPEGSVYKISIVGNSMSRPQSGNRSPLESNRSYVYWGTVGLGHSVQQQFTLRNVSQTQSLFLYLKVKPGESSSDGCSFQLVDEGLATSSSTSALALSALRLVSHYNVTLNPLESRIVKLSFLPRSPGPYSATLVIRHRHSRQQGGTNNAARLKFPIPLRGFGGVAVLVFDGLQQTRMSSPAGINVQTSDGQKTIAISGHNNMICSLHCESTGGVSHFVARNTGHRTAFVKIVASSDKASIIPIPNRLSVKVQPSEFILQEGDSCPVKVFVQSHSSSSPFFHLIICYGENVLRQRYCLLPLPLSEHPEDILLRTQLKLHENFTTNEIQPRLAGATVAGPQWPACQADRTQLIASLKIQWVLVQPTPRDSPFRSPSLRLNSASDLDENFPHGTFFPLEAEVTLSDITVLPYSNAPSSPPSKETPSSVHVEERAIIVEPISHVFQTIACGQSSKVKITLKSIGYRESVLVNILKPSAPFHMNFESVLVKPNHYLSIPVTFRPTTQGMFSSTVLLYPYVGTGAQTLAVSLQGEAV